MHMQVFIKDELIAEVDFDPIQQTVGEYKTYSKDVVWLPFGVCMNPDYGFVESFLESRCPPRERVNIKELLHNWGLDFYDPLAIVQKTYGRMLADYLWVKFDDDPVTYQDVKIRD